MIDQLIIEEKASYDDYSASLSQRNIGMPKKKSIKKTVPFSNKTYDFSAINGEVYWEERELEYVFEIIAATPEELEELKAAFAAWVMGVTSAKIYDPFIEDYHFVGTFDELKFDDDEGLDKTTATVKFLAYPYKVANYDKTVSFFTYGGYTQHTFTNNGGHPVIPTITTDAELLIVTENNSRYALSAGEWVNAAFILKEGTTDMLFYSDDGANVTVTYREEVF